MSEDNMIFKIRDVANRMKNEIMRLEEKTRAYAMEMLNDDNSELCIYNMSKEFKRYDAKYWTAKSMYDMFYNEFKEYLKEESDENE